MSRDGNDVDKQEDEVDAQEEQIMVVKAAKTKAKTAFTKARNQLVQQIAIGRQEIAEVQQQMILLEKLFESATAELEKLLELAEDNLPLRRRTIKELETLESEFGEVVSLIADLRKKTWQTESESVNYEERGMRRKEVEAALSRRAEIGERQRRMKEDYEARLREMENEMERLAMVANEQSLAIGADWSENSNNVDVSAARRADFESRVGGNGIRPSESAVKQPTQTGEVYNVRGDKVSGWKSAIGAERVEHQPQMEWQAGQSYQRTGMYSQGPAEAVGQDMWRQLQRVAIPVFSGDKRQYEGWRAAFYACVDAAPSYNAYKLLQLRQSLQGEALRLIANLGYSEFAYRAALERLEREYGGERRRLMLALEDLDNFRPIQSENAVQLKKLADLLDVTVVNLRAAGRESELNNNGLMYLRVQKKLPAETLTRFHRWVGESRREDSLIVLHQWLLKEAEYLTVACEAVRGVASSGDVGRDSGAKVRLSVYRGEPAARTHFGKLESLCSQSGERVVERKGCSFCGAPHGVWACSRFQRMEPEARWAAVRDKRLCFCCLGANHRLGECKRVASCNVEGCKAKHHRLLHPRVQVKSAAYHHEGGSPKTIEKPMAVQEQNVKRNGSQESCTLLARNSSSIALRTVPIILANGEREVRVNALLDDASTRSYLNSDVAAELGLDGKFESMTVKVLNGQVSTFQTIPVEVDIRSLDGAFRTRVTAHTTEKVTGGMQAVDWSLLSKRWAPLRGVPFDKIEGKQTIDMLIGVDHADLHFACREVGGQPGEPIARLTPIGWTCVGPVDRVETIGEAHQQAFFALAAESEASSLIRKLWEVDEVPEGGVQARMTTEEQKVVEMTRATLKVEGGRFQVSIPWKTNPEDLPRNRQAAEQRLMSTEKRLLKDQELAKSYQSVIDKHLAKGYIREVDSNEQHPSSEWFLPHFAVVRVDKETTKVRIVFDASARCGGVCLNDTIHPGPKLQQDLLKVLLRFRKHPIALACDIEEMFLRVRLAPADRRFFRFLWRELDLKKDPKRYEFCSVVFGVNCSPFLAQFVAQENARDHQEQLPLATATVLSSTYMDDSLDSVADVGQAVKLYEQLVELWSKAGMRACKWMSNSAEVLRQIPLEDRAERAELLLKGEARTTKALGVNWNAKEDVLGVSISEASIVNQTMTKRLLLRRVAEVFDPCGFLAPVVIKGKLMLQLAWQQGVGWDEALEPELAEQASMWTRQLSKAGEISVPRCLRPENGSTELHTFVDASQEAYGAVVYLRSVSAMDVSVRFVAAKAKVAPLQAVSIPRLELMAAVLGLRLARAVAEALEVGLETGVFWSDSHNVLWWIRRQSRSFKPFVANRVAFIQQQVRPRQWRYVPTGLNPADVASRGCRVQELIEGELWWCGPAFLMLDSNSWPETPIPIAPEMPEMSTRRRESASDQEHQAHGVFVASAELTDEADWRLKPDRFSSFYRLQRITAWVLRFIRNCQKTQAHRSGGDLSVDELNEVEERLIRMAQKEEFKADALSDKRLTCLQPIVDATGILRVDGRLKFRQQLPFAARHPAILPRKHWLTKLIIKQHHEDQRHGGTNQVLAALSAKFWVISAREAIREWEVECAACRREKARPISQQMAPLPDARLEGSLKAFTNVAVDMGGPFITVQGRFKKRQKRYLALFTCLETRAVHLEMTYSLDADAFLNAFYRMVNRRGLPKTVHSDNGGNFVKGAEELRLLEELDKARVSRETVRHHISWRFQPPAAPHFGGAHEVMIRAAKRALHAILGNADVNDEELQSAITGAEALINSRPITYQSANPRDEEPLTPNHFLIGQAGGQFAPEVPSDVAVDPRRRWRRVQELVRHVWRRWMREWLPGLQPRTKWMAPQRDVRLDDVVLVVKADTPRGHWPLGRVLRVYPGRDGRVRVAQVQVGETQLVRPVSKLCLIEG